ncbi:MULTISPECIES: DUF2169 domain-containing protein [unclassified Variovorax]|uniref:DUF2169 family type VI secretion system accessory protein n=1 Tax=unclassified Variovorax TaxID=663243 RepID=UPI00076C5FCC|nr:MULTISPECIES: DUF2169 domain-containing protein [unclassified Variovorax]KWT92961.1 hypothetical protein APY03_2953 [Variovorax sp. WDL1]PNG51906.1 Secreted effector protein PipB2 [Variovorax sp. B2]PNG54253.1 Secreted effector protein PipB2 [Variovorax sp. B4]VTV11741.1 Type III effector pipB2 [Variovorax sp. WDL1]
MHVIKPQVLGLSARPMEYRKRFGLCVSGYLHVPFAQAARGTLWNEQSMWNFLTAEMAVPLIDEGIAKLTPEFLVHGHAWPAPGRPEAVAVRARLGARDKTLLVFGDRYWDAGAPSRPRPFERMPLAWTHAYGGPDFAPNPQGRGRSVEGGVQWLPNLELPGARLQRPDQAVTPAGFGPLDVMHPQRAALRGTYDDAWLQAHAPGFPPDVDWRYFNLAPSDQWLEAPLRGDEHYALDHMHPERPRIEGTLPGLRVRAFANYRVDGDTRLREIPMRLTTVWFFPHAERMVLIHQGLAETGEDDGAEVRQLLGAVERLDEPRAPEHYLEVLGKRLDGRRAAVQALNDADLVPAGLDTVDPGQEQAQAVMKSDGLREDAQYRRAQIDVEMARDQLRAQGKDPDALGVRLAPREKPPTAQELPAYLEKLEAEMEKQQWAAVEDAVTQLENAQAFMREKKLDPERLVHRGPPSYRASAQLAEIEKGFALGERIFDRSTMAPQLLLQEVAHHLDYLKSAHMQPPVAPLAGERAAEARREIEWLLARGTRQLPAADFTGADFSNLDLRGIDFTGAWLESARFSGANLSGAIFRAAVLAHADLRGAIAIGTVFQAANLGRALLGGAVFDRAEFSGANLQYCGFEATQLRQARLAGAELMDTRWGAADWSGVVGPGLLFYKLDMKGVVLAEAELAACNFIECDLQGLDFRGAKLAGSNFIGCRLARADFSGAHLAGASFVQATSLAQAEFSGADLQGANLGECNLTGARLVRARLDGANLGMAQLADCDARLASAKGALLRKAVLTRARLAGVDFKDAILQRADLRGADLRNANLFGADLSRIRLDGDARLEGALLQRARTWPRLAPEQHAGGTP